MGLGKDCRMSKVSIMSQAIATKACSGLNTMTRRRNRRRLGRSRNVCSLQAPGQLLVLALMGLLEPLIARVRHGCLDPGPAR